MNCREINHVLDSHEADALTAAQRQAIDIHFATCASCREEWANWHAIAALSVPAASPELQARVAAALPAQSGAQRRRWRSPRRPIVIGSLMVVGAAVAATFAVRFHDDGVDVGSGSSSAPASASAAASVESSAEADVAPVAATTTPATDARASGAAVAGDAGPVAELAASDGAPLDPFSVVVLRRPERAASEIEIAELTNCHAAIVDQLRAITGLNVVADGAVSSFADSGLSDREIAGQLGAGKYVEVGTSNGCNARLWNTQTGERLEGSTYAGASVPPVNGWGGFAFGFAMSVRDATLKDPTTVVAEAKAMLLNPALPDRQRIGALNELRAGRELSADAYDSAVIAAATRIGTDSTDPSARASAWVGLRGIDDPVIVAPLLQSLANDGDETVRMQAATSLNTFLDEPGVRDALLQSAASDPSREPIAACCIPTVREAAQWASMTRAELPAWGRETLFDESLPARSRLVPVAMAFPDGRQLPLSDLGQDAANVVFDIGRREQDPRVRQMAWRALSQAPRNDDFAPVLLEDLVSHPDEYVRSSAAMILGRYADDSAVRETLEQALEDPSMAVRRNATAALRR